ncbi:MAG: hypothetical protein ACE5JX_15060 [Acidobacteriota bacterium]
MPLPVQVERFLRMRSAERECRGNDEDGRAELCRALFEDRQDPLVPRTLTCGGGQSPNADSIQLNDAMKRKGAEAGRKARRGWSRRRISRNGAE